MQFNKTFLIASLITVMLLLTGWRVAAKTGMLSPQEEAAQEEQDGKKDDKLQKAFKSLNKKSKGKETAITVEAEPVVRGDLIQTVSAQGRVYANVQMEVTSEISGRLVKLHVKDGTRLKKGDIIAEIDSRPYRLALKDAEVALLEARANYMEYDPDLSLANAEYKPDQELVDLEARFKKGEISQDSYDREKHRLELKALASGDKRGEVIAARILGKAEVAVDRARLDLEKCTIRAPFNGIIFELSVSEGVLLGGSTKISRLINLTDLVVKAQVLESEIGSVQSGRPARVKFTALPDLEEIGGKVQAISPFVNETNKTVETILAITSKDGRIRPGMFSEAKIDARIFEDRLMVPKAAILPRDDRKVVFKVSPEKRAKWEYVTTGVENDEYVEIVKGNLQPGDMVLTDNHFTMGHDTLVKIAKKKK